MPKPIKVLDNANQIISLLSEIGSANVMLIASEIGMPRSSVYRLVDGLAAIGLVRTDDSGQVRLAARWLHLAEAAQASLPEWRAQIAKLERITSETGHTSFLSMRTDTGAACIAWAPATSLIVLSLRPGRELPFNVGAAGRLLYALSSRAERVRALEHAPLTPLTDESLSTPEALEADAELVLARGWALSKGDVTPGVSAVGVPAHADDSPALGCISVSGLSTDIDPQAEELASYLSGVAGA